jgi:predicted aspartyl protease
MSTFSRSFGRGGLVGRGPVVPLRVSIPDVWSAALESRGFQLPLPVEGEALIDTGSTISAVDQVVVDRLGLVPLDEEVITTPMGQSRQTLHPAQVAFLGAPFAPLVSDKWIAANLRPFGAVVLLGRDALADFVLTYDGKAGAIKLEK